MKILTDESMKAVNGGVGNSINTYQFLDVTPGGTPVNEWGFLQDLTAVPANEAAYGGGGGMFFIAEPPEELAGLLNAESRRK